MRTILVTGGAGFIGSNFVRKWVKENPDDNVVIFDAFTYAARPAHIEGLRCNVNKVDITDRPQLRRALQVWRPDHVFHFAAESHVCNSITGPETFMKTNFMGTFNLIEELRDLWHGGDCNRFVHVSTDEVFGELGMLPHQKFREDSLVKPRSPYAASKAASDLLVLSWFETYGFPGIVTNCSNNFGPNQHPEKLIPRTIKHILEGKPVVVHGSGRHVRDWLYVAEHCEALRAALLRGRTGGRYCLGGEFECSNLEMIDLVHGAVETVSQKRHELRLEFSGDRPTDDARYSVDTTLATGHLNWRPDPDSLISNLESTVRWYLEHDFFQARAEAHG